MAAGILFGCISIAYPYGRDQGIYAYAGKLLLLGKADFKYVFDVKPPGVHYLFGLEQFLLGESMLKMRLFDIVWESATAYVIFIIAFRLSKSFKSSLFSAVVYIFLYYRLDYWHTLQADGFLNLPFALTLLFMQKSGNQLPTFRSFIGGVLFAIVILFKYTLIVYAPFVLVSLFFVKGKKISEKIWPVFLFVLGVSVAVSVVMMYYYLNDAFAQFADVQLKQIPLYANIGFDTVDKSFITSNVIRLFFGSVYSPLIAFTAVSFVFYLVKKELDYDKLLVYFWAITAVASLIAQWKFFYYHFLVIIPPLAIGSAMFFEILGRMKIRALASVSMVLIVIIYFAMGFKPYVENYQNLSDLKAGRKSLSELYIQNGTTTDSVFMMGKTFRAVDYVESTTNPNDKIFVWGFDPLVYYLSGRTSSSRFIYNFPLCWKGNNEAFRKEFMSELNSNTPELILIAQKDPLPYISGYDEDSKQLVERFPEFKQFIEEKYDYKTQIDDFYYYQLKNENGR